MNMQPLSPHDETLLTTILRQNFGAECHIVSYAMQSRAEDYAVLVAQLAQPSLQVVTKIAGPRAPVACPFDRTAAIARLVRTYTTVPIFGVVAADVSYKHYPWRYMISTYQQGQRWSEVWPQLDGMQLRDAYSQLGDAVARVHNIPFAEFGELAADATLPFGSTIIQALYIRARRRIKNPQIAERYIALLKERAGLFADAQPGLTHDDLNPGNILFQQNQGRWQLSALLDWDSAWAGCPESDLARMELWQGMMGPGFREAYVAHRPISPSYPPRRPLYQLLWCLEYARTTLRHEEDTKRVCAELRVPAELFLPQASW